ncbi:GNAT family protein [Ammonicoccus fulvus]|uniref:GNAT family protein n=1 Tax=Ammonicoccus fulvus TaxID=3138240 RepID=A0ABZ3FSG6_9ACTN
MLPKTMPKLIGSRVTRREFRAADASFVQSVSEDPLIPLITTVPASGTVEHALAYIARQHDRLRTGAGYSFAIVENHSAQPVGQIGLWLSGIKEGRASTGYWISPRFRRRGLVGAALQVLSDWALSLEEVERLELHVEPWNEGSWRAAEACGFEREGLLRSWRQVGTERRDMFMYTRLRRR